MFFFLALLLQRPSVAQAERLEVALEGQDEHDVVDLEELPEVPDQAAGRAVFCTLPCSEKLRKTLFMH